MHRITAMTLHMYNHWDQSWNNRMTSTVTTFIGAAIKRNTAMITQCSGQSTSTNTQDWESRLSFVKCVKTCAPNSQACLTLCLNHYTRNRLSVHQPAAQLTQCCILGNVVKQCWWSYEKQFDALPNIQNWIVKSERKATHTYIHQPTTQTKYQDNGIARIATHWPIMLQQADHTGWGLQVLNNDYVMQGCIPCSHFCYL